MSKRAVRTRRIVNRWKRNRRHTVGHKGGEMIAFAMKLMARQQIIGHTTQGFNALRKNWRSYVKERS